MHFVSGPHVNMNTFYYRCQLAIKNIVHCDRVMKAATSDEGLKCIPCGNDMETESTHKVEAKLVSFQFVSISEMFAHETNAKEPKKSESDLVQESCQCRCDPKLRYFVFVPNKCTFNNV